MFCCIAEMLSAISRCWCCLNYNIDGREKSLTIHDMNPTNLIYGNDRLCHTISILCPGSLTRTVYVCAYICPLSEPERRGSLGVGRSIKCIFSNILVPFCILCTNVMKSYQKKFGLHWRSFDPPAGHSNFTIEIQ